MSQQINRRSLLAGVLAAIAVPWVRPAASSAIFAKDSIRNFSCGDGVFVGTYYCHSDKVAWHDSEGNFHAIKEAGQQYTILKETA